MHSVLPHRSITPECSKDQHNKLKRINGERHCRPRFDTMVLCFLILQYTVPIYYLLLYCCQVSNQLMYSWPHTSPGIHLGHIPYGPSGLRRSRQRSHVFLQCVCGGGAVPWTWRPSWWSEEVLGLGTWWQVQGLQDWVQPRIAVLSWG